MLRRRLRPRGFSTLGLLAKILLFACLSTLLFSQSPPSPEAVKRYLVKRKPVIEKVYSTPRPMLWVCIQILGSYSACMRPFLEFVQSNGLYPKGEGTLEVAFLDGEHMKVPVLILQIEDERWARPPVFLALIPKIAPIDYFRLDVNGRFTETSVDNPSEGLLSVQDLGNQVYFRLPPSVYGAVWKYLELVDAKGQSLGPLAPFVKIRHDLAYFEPAQVAARKGRPPVRIRGFAVNELVLKPVDVALRYSPEVHQLLQELAARGNGAMHLSKAGRVHHTLEEAANNPQSPLTKRFVDEELRGIPETSAIPEAPGWADPNLVSMLIFDKVETYGDKIPDANWIQVQGGDGQDWLLVSRDCQPDVMESLALVRLASKPAVPGGSGIANSPQGKPVVQVLGILKNADPNHDDILSPEPFENDDTSYPNPSVAARWIQLAPGNRVLAVDLHRMEGYAGGGADFNATVLLALEGGTLRRVAAFQSGYGKLLAGNWNEDGTREHIEANAEWKLKVFPGKTNWPVLKLIATTPRTRSAWLVWNADLRIYELWTN